MSQPTRTVVHIDKPLTNMSIAYKQDQTAFIADKVFPDIEVDKQSDKYFVFDRGAFFRDDAKLRGSNEESVGSGYSLSNDSYFCDVYALHKDNSRYDVSNTDAPLNQDRAAVEFVTHSLLIRKEKLWAAAAFAVSVWGTTVVGSSTLQWDDYLSSDPIRAVDSAKRVILARTGRMAKTFVAGLDVFLALKEHPDVVDRIKYTSSRVAQEEILAGLLGVDQFLVPYALGDDAPDGRSSSASLSFLLNSKSALLVHTPKSPGIEVPMAGANFVWRGTPTSARPGGMAFRRLPMDLKQSDRIEGEIAIDVAVTGSDLGCFWTSLVA